MHRNVTYCPEIVFCVYNQLLPILVLKRVDIELLVKDGIECSGNLSRHSTKQSTPVHDSHQSPQQ